MKVNVPKEFAETIAIAYLKELYENVIEDTVKLEIISAEPVSVWTDRKERIQELSALITILSSFMTKEEFAAYQSEVHKKYYGNEDYFMNLYGTCNLGTKCQCLKTSWLGQLCPNWKPLGCKSHEDLKLRALNELNRRKNLK